jgi:hypothetical protein
MAENLSENSRCVGRESNRAPPECDCGPQHQSGTSDGEYRERFSLFVGMNGNDGGCRACSTTLGTRFSPGISGDTTSILPRRFLVRKSFLVHQSFYHPTLYSVDTDSVVK